jgi:hypothetical protein
MIRAGKKSLAHVRDIEQSSGAAGVGVFGYDTGLKLDRHFVAGKGHHAGAKCDLAGIKCRLLQGLIRERRFEHLRSSQVSAQDGAVRSIQTGPLCQRT